MTATCMSCGARFDGLLVVPSKFGPPCAHCVASIERNTDYLWVGQMLLRTADALPLLKEMA